MDNCQKCGQIICQSGYIEQIGLYICAACQETGRKEALGSKYGRFWHVKLFWNNILNRLAVYWLFGEESFVSFAENLSNEIGEFELKHSDQAHKLHLDVEYINRAGKVELYFWGFKKYNDASALIVFDKFTHKLIKIVSVRGDYSNIVVLTKSMTELLKSGVEFEEKLCHC